MCFHCEPYFVSYWWFFLVCFDRIWSGLECPVDHWWNIQRDSNGKLKMEETVCICSQPPLVNSSTPVTWWPLFGPCPSIYPEAHPSLQRSSQNCTSSAKCCSVFLPADLLNVKWVSALRVCLSQWCWVIHATSSCVGKCAEEEAGHVPSDMSYGFKMLNAFANRY